MMEFGKRDIAILGLSLAFALVYTYCLQYGLYPSKPFIKGPVILLLALFAFLNTEGRTRLLLTLALILSSVGDIFLALPPSYFVHGLISFLIAHLFYIALFLRFRRPALTAKDGLVAAGLALYGIGLVAFLYPSLGPMTVPVCVYAAVLLGMGFTSSLSRFPLPLLFIGALIFISSDSGIAINKFIGAGEWLGYATWSTYVVAQYLITLSVVKYGKQ